MSGPRWALVLSLFVAAAALGSEAQPPGLQADLRHVLGSLQYLVGDYPEGVDETGRVFDYHEYKEHSEMLGDIVKTLRHAPAVRRNGVWMELQGVRAAIETHRPPHEVVPRLRRLHARIVKAYRVRLSPETVPSLAVGRILYQESCAICHAADGSGDTPQAHGLAHPPDDLRDAEQDERLSPYAVFTIVTYGVPGTAMASFETLSEEERWSLGFYVMALRHPEPEAAGVPDSQSNAFVAVGADSAATTRLDLEALSDATDADLLRKLVTLPEPERRTQVAHWRWHLPLEIAN